MSDVKRYVVIGKRLSGALIDCDPNDAALRLHDLLVHERDYAQLQQRCEEMASALRELLAASMALMPAFEEGAEAQNAWADRRAAARNNAVALLGATP